MRSLFWSALLCLTVASGSAFACGSGKVLFEDKFETLDPAWDFDKEDSERANGPGGVTYKLAPGDNVELLNQSGLFNDYEVCGVFTSNTPKEADAWVGVVFWASDKDNSYEADVYPAWGTYVVYRYQNGKALKPVPATRDDAVVKGEKARNEISVTVVGNKATVSVNGKKMIDFTGRAPDGGSLFGFALGTLKTDSGPSTMTLQDIQVREVAKP